jgi:hypothetical protein
MSALARDVRDLEATHDALVREIERKYAELDQVGAKIKAENERLAHIRAEIQKVKTKFGV